MTDVKPTSFATHTEVLLTIARTAIAAGLAGDSPWPLTAVGPATVPAALTLIRATFVTLHQRGELRGCMGALEASRPLMQDVAEHAYAAAFQDPRFPPVTQAEWQQIDLQISILSPLQELTGESEADVVSQINPGVDGILLEEGAQHATFLPSVWEALPRPRQFMEHLKRKAGWQPEYWSSRMRVYRYQTETIPA